MKVMRSDLAASLRSRVPYDVSGPMFQLHGVPRGRGWPGTVEKLIDKKTLSNKKAAALVGALKEHELVGEKLCRFYRVDPAVAKALKHSVMGTKIEKGPMQKAFPFLLSEAELAKSQLGQATLLAVEEFDGGTAIVFGTVRAITVREPVDPNALPDGAAQILQYYDEIVGLKTIRYQAMDVIWLPEKGSVIDLRVDFPKGTHADIGLASQSSTMNAFRRLTGENPFKAPVNLFPALKKMYDAQNEGRVVELAFGTTTRSIKHERMRLSEECLRNELYHVGGKKRLKTPVRPYRISIAYTVDLDNGVEARPELNMHTTSYVAERANPKLYDALIRKTVGLIDYEHIRQRILHFTK